MESHSHNEIEIGLQKQLLESPIIEWRDGTRTTFNNLWLELNEKIASSQSGFSENTGTTISMMIYGGEIISASDLRWTNYDEATSTLFELSPNKKFKIIGNTMILYSGKKTTIDIILNKLSVTKHKDLSSISSYIYGKLTELYISQVDIIKQNHSNSLSSTNNGEIIDQYIKAELPTFIVGGSKFDEQNKPYPSIIKITVDGFDEGKISSNAQLLTSGSGGKIAYEFINLSLQRSMNCTFDENLAFNMNASEVSGQALDKSASQDPHTGFGAIVHRITMSQDGNINIYEPDIYSLKHSIPLASASFQATYDLQTLFKPTKDLQDFSKS
jgi:hypothetical protein